MLDDAPWSGRLVEVDSDQIEILGTSLVVQWLRLRAPNAGGLGSIPGQGTRSHTLQLKVRMPQLKIPHAAMKILHAATKTQHSQIIN